MQRQGYISVFLPVAFRKGYFHENNGYFHESKDQPLALSSQPGSGDQKVVICQI